VQATRATAIKPSSTPSRGDWIENTGPAAGVALLRAWFVGTAYARHRHDTYAVCVTDRGLQAIDYRGAARTRSPRPRGGGRCRRARHRRHGDARRRG
jgi:hypothetical protein